MVRLAAGDTAALGGLYDRHQPAVRRFLSRMTGNAADVEDAVHATFLEALRGARHFDASRSPRAWLLGIAHNVWRRSRSRGARWSRLLQLFSNDEPSIPKDPERALEAREQLGRLGAALAALSEEKRAVVLLSEVEGLSGKEVAAALDIPVSTVWTRLHHARRELLSAMADEEVQ